VPYEDWIVEAGLGVIHISVVVYAAKRFIESVEFKRLLLDGF
jgi:hypothetical protein